jgi:hypothetical protein
MKNSKLVLPVILWSIFGGLLFALLFLHLAFAAQGKPFWLDESNSLHWFTKYGLWETLRNGADGESNRSPLSYVVFRSLMRLWNDRPQEFWDLRFFFRIPTAFFWAAANTFLFFFLKKRLAEIFSRGVSILLALGATIFCFSNSFATYYAIEARPFSLWLSLSLLQTLFLWELLGGRSRTTAILFFFTNLVLAFTTYASVAQIGIACLLLQAHEASLGKKWLWWGPLQKYLFLNLSCSFFLIWYYLPNQKMTFTPSPFELYFISVREVVLKTFHHHGTQPAWVSFPFFFLWVPYFWARENKKVFFFCLSSVGLLLSTFILYLGTLRGGALFYSRYAIYIVPGLSFLYVFGLAALARLADAWLTKKIKQSIFVPLLVIWSLFQVIPSVWEWSLALPKDYARFQQRHSYEKNPAPLCVEDIAQLPDKLEAQNDFCRGI